MTIEIGMTGNRDGLSPEQRRIFESLLANDMQNVFGQQISFHHGDCVGSDADTHHIAKSMGAFVIVHPPENPTLRAYCEGHATRVEKGYFARNRDIVNESLKMYGFPSHKNEKKGGTWYTIKYSVSQHVPVTIIYSDGSVEQR